MMNTDPILTNEPNCPDPDDVLDSARRVSYEGDDVEQAEDWLREQADEWSGE